MEGAQVLHSRDQALPPAAHTSATTTLNCVQQYHSNKGLKMDQNQFAHIRDSKNVYYPFTSKSKWEFENWLSSDFLSQKEIDLYLHSQYVSAYLSDTEWLLMSEQNKEHPISFHTVKDSPAWIESLPDIPWWRSQEIKVRPYSTKSLMVLYW